jgi:hypothetical protein
VNALRKQALTHRGALQRYAGPGPVNGAGLIEQVFGVVAWIVPTSDRRSIAHFFREHGQLALQPPCQRMEPKDAPIQGREPLDQRIAPTGVFALVRQHGIQFSTRPLAP